MGDGDDAIKQTVAHVTAGAAQHPIFERRVLSPRNPKHQLRFPRLVLAPRLFERGRVVPGEFDSVGHLRPLGDEVAVASIAGAVLRFRPNEAGPWIREQVGIPAGRWRVRRLRWLWIIGPGRRGVRFFRLVVSRDDLPAGWWRVVGGRRRVGFCPRRFALLGLVERLDRFRRRLVWRFPGRFAGGKFAHLFLPAKPAANGRAWLSRIRFVLSAASAARRVLSLISSCTLLIPVVTFTLNSA